MKKQLHIIMLLVFTNSNLLAQSESSNWYFGIYAGVTFNSGVPVALTNGALSTHEGVASVSDSAGNLLFYTDGKIVYDATHAVMLNGTGLLGDASSTQSCIIVKKPLSNSLYFVFTMADVTSAAGFRYSIVDMTLNGGLGAVTLKNIVVYSSAREKLTSVKHANGTDYWILINAWNDDKIRAFRLDSSGVDTAAVISDAGPIRYGTYSYSLGYMKASRQNNRLAFGTWTLGNFIVVDFDNSTGIADSSTRLDLQGTAWSYGVEFSPDGNLLYCSTLSNPQEILQFDLSLGNDSIIYANRYVITSGTGLGCSSFRYGALQLGPDGKIYGVNVCDSSLFVINYPDLPGASCGFVSQAVALGSGTCDLGLPNLISDEVLPSTSVENIRENEGFMIYPNPANNVLHVLTPIAIGKKFKVGDVLNIYNVLGQETYSSKIQSSLITIDVSKFDKGVYFVQMRSVVGEMNVHSKKLLIE